MAEPKIDEIRKKVADEWGSHLCYHDKTTFRRNCDPPVHCRCYDIAVAIMTHYELKPRIHR